MKLERGPIPIDFARELVDEALTVASKSATASLQAAFREEKDAVSSIEIVDIREKRLDALDSQWMERLNVPAALETVLARHQGLENLISRCVVKLARAKEDEHAFLVNREAPPPGAGAVKPALVVQLTAQTLLELDRLEALLSTTLVRARRPS